MQRIVVAIVLAVCVDTTPSVAPHTATWDEMMRDVFDPAWILPERLPLESREGSGPSWDLAPKLIELSKLVVDPATDDPGAPRCLGDVVRDARKARKSGQDERTVFDRVRKCQPKLWAEIEPCAAELACDAKLRSKKWDPDDDDKSDGLFFARPLTIEKLATRPWDKIDGSHLVQQAAAVIVADFEAIKSAESNYPNYPKRKGSTYEAIYPVAGTYARGVDAAKHPFAALKLHFECDLPFPFSTYTCDLRILNRTDERGNFACDIFSPSRDFIWLAGRDVFVPLRASDGSWVGTIVVRIFGFDLKGVPDGDDDRRAALRGSLGALKRESEDVFATYAGPPRTIAGQVPEFVVLGGK